MPPRRAVIIVLLAVAGIALATPASVAATTATRTSPSTTSAVTHCTFEYMVTAWSGGNFAGSLVVTNIGQEAVNNWWIEFDLSGNGWIMTGWNGTFQQSENHVRVDAPIWHPHLQPAEYAEPGFTGSYSATLGVVLSNIRLNGVPCSEPI